MADRAFRATTSSSGPRLPEDLAREEAELRSRLSERRLVVFWPRPGALPPSLDSAQLDHLAAWAARHDVIVGVREDVVDSLNSWTYALRQVVGVGLAARSVPHASTVLRVADAVVTDDADEAVDFLLTGRRLLHWSPSPSPSPPPTSPTDEAYFSPDAYLPGPVSRTFDELLTALDTVFEPLDAEWQASVRQGREARLRPP